MGGKVVDVFVIVLISCCAFITLPRVVVALDYNEDHHYGATKLEMAKKNESSGEELHLDSRDPRRELLPQIRIPKTLKGLYKAAEKYADTFLEIGKEIYEKKDLLESAFDNKFRSLCRGTFHCCSSYSRYAGCTKYCCKKRNGESIVVLQLQPCCCPNSRTSTGLCRRYCCRRSQQVGSINTNG